MLKNWANGKFYMLPVTRKFWIFYSVLTIVCEVEINTNFALKCMQDFLTEDHMITNGNHFREVIMACSLR